MAAVSAVSRLQHELPVELVEARAGRSLAVHIHRNARTPHVLIFLHGSCATLLQWEAQLAAFREEYTVVAFDMYGCGRSPKPREWEAYSTTAHTDDLAFIVSRFGSGGGGKTALVAHSAAVGLALRLAARRDGGIDALALVSGVDSTPSTATSPFSPFRLPLCALRMLHPKLDSAFEQLALHPTTREASSVAHRQLLEVCREANKGNDMYMVKAYYRQLRLPTLEMVASVNVPCLVLYGSGDQLVSPECSRRLHRYLERGGGRAVMHEIEQAAHQVMQERPEKVNALLGAFLADAML